MSLLQRYRHFTRWQKLVTWLGLAFLLFFLWITKIMLQEEMTYTKIKVLSKTGRVFMSIGGDSLQDAPSDYKDMTKWFENGQYQVRPIQKGTDDEYFFGWLGYLPQPERKWALAEINKSDAEFLLQLAQSAVIRRANLSSGDEDATRRTWYRRHMLKNEEILKAETPDLRNRVRYAGLSWFDKKTLRPIDVCWLYLIVNDMPYVIQFTRWGDTGAVRTWYSDYSKREVVEDWTVLSNEHEPEHQRVFVELAVGATIREKGGK